MKFLPYRRKRNGRTNYKKRLTLLVSGSSRIVIRKTNKNMIVQIVDYSDKGDTVIVNANSSELKKLGWDHATGNLPAAYLTGMLAAKKALKKKVNSAIVDLGLQIPSKGSRLFAAVKGAIDGGLDVKASDEAFPNEERLKGSHINAQVSKMFDDVKSKISKS
ncbi:MAG: 50S ribosomal protein L18 [Candidatus Woesearchaeota archaeon]